MYIHRIILRDVHNFDKLDITLYDDLWQKPLNSVLLLGPNGSGKTTLLRIIAILWEHFGEWISLDEPSMPLNPLLADAGLVAIEIKQAYPTYGLDEVTLPFILYPDDSYYDSTWLFCASDLEKFEDLKRIANKQHEKEAIFIGTIGGEKLQPQSETERAWLGTIAKHKSILELGVDKVPAISNLIFLDTPNRQIISPKGAKPSSRTPEPSYKWFVTYEASDRWDGHIETILENMKLRDPLGFGHILDSINQFFGDEKRVGDFDNNIRLNVELKRNKKKHPLSELSSGETACLVMIVMVSRWMMPGGIVLIDEPDLHLHVSLQRHFIRQIEKIVHERGGQLIVTSHSQDIWDNFYESNQFHLGVSEPIHE